MRANVTQTQRLLPCQSKPAKTRRGKVCVKKTHIHPESPVHPYTLPRPSCLQRSVGSPQIAASELVVNVAVFSFRQEASLSLLKNAPLRAVDHAVRLCNPLSSDGLSRRRPISGRPSSQSSCASTTSESFGHRHPLPFMSVLVLCTVGGRKIPTHRCSACIWHHCVSSQSWAIGERSPKLPSRSPVVFYCLDDEAQRRTDCVDVFTHNSLDYGRLPCVVEATWEKTLSANGHVRGAAA